MAEPLWVDKK